MPKITQRIVNALDAKSGETFTWDSELRGFGVRTKPSGTRTYLIQYRRPGGQQRRHAFAQHPTLTASEARAEARQLLAAVATGSDPSQMKREARGALSVADLCDEYLNKAEAGEITTRRGGKPKKPSTLTTDRGRIERHIKPLLGRIAVRDLTALNVRTFIREITSGKTATELRPAFVVEQLSLGAKVLQRARPDCLEGYSHLRSSRNIVPTILAGVCAGLPTSTRWCMSPRFNGERWAKRWTAQNTMAWRGKRSPPLGCWP